MQLAHRRNIIRRIPYDTSQVYHGGNIEDPMMAMIMAANRRARELESEVRAGESLKVYGESLTEPILGKDLELPEQEAILPKCAFDTTMLHVRTEFVCIHSVWH